MGLNHSRAKLESALGKMGELVRGSRADYRARSLLVLAHIFSCRETEMEPHGLTNEDCYQLISSDLLGQILSIIRQPFAELHLAALELLLSLSRWEWSQRKMHAVPGLVEYLLDRRTENLREGKELKFQIWRTLATAPSTEAVFGSDSLIKFRTNVLDGPYHLGEEANVAMEEM